MVDRGKEVDEKTKSIILNKFITNKFSLKNRFVMAPVPTGFVENGVPTSKNIQFYGDRAKSVGLIIAGVININHITASNHIKTPNIDTKEEIESWKKITNEVHRNDGKIVAQIWHSGGYRKFCIKDAKITTPSGIVNGEKIDSPMTRSEIDSIISKFAATASNVKRAGFDGVEIHGAHGGLIHDFFCPQTNLRNDEYGIMNRTFFAEQIIRACKQQVGDLFPIFFRISNFKMYDYNAYLALSPEEFEKFILPISNSGVDVFDCSALRCIDNAFKGYDGCLAYWTKKITKKPTINVGCIGSKKPFINDTSTIINKLSSKPDSLTETNDKVKLFYDDFLCKSIKNKEFDLIAAGRPLLLDAEWINRL